jgi:hypothetical protein
MNGATPNRDEDPAGPVRGILSAAADSRPATLSPQPAQPPSIPDHELLRRIGGGSYGEVWLARNVVGTFRAVKIVHRHSFDHDRPYEREYAGIQKFRAGLPHARRLRGHSPNRTH